MSNLATNQCQHIAMQANTIFDQNGNPESLYFHCNHLQEGIANPALRRIFSNAVNGNAKLNMFPNQACTGNAVAAHCGNRRGALSECRCEDLNRITKPHLRHNFENHVINRILRQVNGLERGFQFTLAIFCCGGLLGEEILLFRLFNELFKRHFTGIFNLILIDQCYQNSIQQGNPVSTLRQQADLNQFLDEVTHCLPNSIDFHGRVFKEATDYARSGIKHDLLIGADIEGTQRLMGYMQKQCASQSALPPITLVKWLDILPTVCLVNPEGSLCNCYHPQPEKKTDFIENAVDIVKTVINWIFPT